MGMLKSIADLFRSAPESKPTDRYGVLSPLLATSDYVTTTAQAFTIFKGTVYADFMNGKARTTNKHVLEAIDAYKRYVKGLSNQEQSLERAQPFSTIVLALESISGNIGKIEDNFQDLFGLTDSQKPESSLRASSLIVIGYLEKADNFATWLGSLVQHMTADAGDMIPPFRTKDMQSKATEASEFATCNLHKWNYKTDSLLGEVKMMQRKGSDLAILTDTGQWIDEFAHDNQFSPMEQSLMVASMRSPIMMAITWGHVRTQDKIELLSTRKEWLTAKIILEQNKLRGMDPESPEYKRLHRAVDKYSDMVSKFEQKLERMRA